jgi:non-homologous end joining protein Ku
MVCNHPQHIIDLRQQITYLQRKQFRPPQYNRTEFEQQIRTLTQEKKEPRMTPAAPGTDEHLRQELADMSQRTQQSAEKV